MTTFAPFLAKATAAARPMPVKAPVIKTTELLIVILQICCPTGRAWKAGRGFETETTHRCFVERHVASLALAKKTL
jgi:hypothetical protein